MNTIKFILIRLEMLIMVISVILGIGAAESAKWGWAFILLFGPAIWGWLTNFNKQINFCEVYERARNINSK